MNIFLNVLKLSKVISNTQFLDNLKSSVQHASMPLTIVLSNTISITFILKQDVPDLKNSKN